MERMVQIKHSVLPKLHKFQLETYKLDGGNLGLANLFIESGWDNAYHLQLAQGVRGEVFF